MRSPALTRHGARACHAPSRPLFVVGAYLAQLDALYPRLHVPEAAGTCRALPEYLALPCRAGLESVSLRGSRRAACVLDAKLLIHLLQPLLTLSLTHARELGHLLPPLVIPQVSCCTQGRLERLLLSWGPRLLRLWRGSPFKGWRRG